MSLSRTLRKQEIREIGRSLSGDDLGIRNIRVSQVLGKQQKSKVESKVELRISSKIDTLPVKERAFYYLFYQVREKYEFLNYG